MDCALMDRLHKGIGISMGIGVAPTHTLRRVMKLAHEPVRDPGSPAPNHAINLPHVLSYACPSIIIHQFPLSLVCASFRKNGC